MSRSKLALLLALSGAPSITAAQVTVQGNTVHEIDAAPGAVRTGSIAVSNFSPTAQVARIYLSDYIFYSDGTSRFDPPGSLRRSNSAWIQLSSQDLTIPAGATIPVTYTVRVPKVDSLAGSYWSLVMVEGVGTPTTASRTGFVLGTTVRYAVQVVTHIANTGQSRLTIKSGKLGADERRGHALQLEIENTGHRATKFDVTTELYDSEGTVRARVQQSRGLTYPGSSLMHNVELGKLPPGTYKAIVVIDAGSGNLSGAQYTLKL